MSIASGISLLSGVALFLFGMSLMGDGLKRVAASTIGQDMLVVVGLPLAVKQANPGRQQH